MIAKIISGTSFRACAQYLLRNETAELLAGSGVRFGSTDELIADFESMLLLVENAPAKPVGHTVLSFPHDERKLSQCELAEIARSYMKQMKIEHTPWVLVRHSDKQHQHIHLMYSAVTYDGQMVDQRHNFARSKKARRSIEEEYRLTRTSGKCLDRTNISALRGADLRRYEILIAARGATTVAKSWPDFVKRMSAIGIGVEVTGSDLSRGVRFSKGGYHFAGSKVDRSLSYRNILRGITLANGKDGNISPILQMARNNRRQTDRLAPIFHDIKQLSRSYMPPIAASHDRDDDEEDRREKRTDEQQENSLYL